MDVWSVGESRWTIEPSWRKSLYSCSLVCRDWVPKSRIHLFRWVELCSEHTAICFMSTIMATPQLGQYVRMLDIDAGGKHSDWFYRVHWVLPQRLPSLIHVTYARLPVLHSSFFILPCRFDKIISLEFRISEEQSFREVVRILNRFTKLQKLVIKGYKAGSFFCRDLHDQEGLLSVDICGVSRYTPTSVDDVCHWLTKKLPPRSLNWLTLRLDNRYTSSRYVRELLVMHSETMKRLEITIGLFDLKKRPNDLGIEDSQYNSILFLGCVG